MDPPVTPITGGDGWTDGKAEPMDARYRMESMLKLFVVFGRAIISW
jgi:hypothetical protein